MKLKLFVAAALIAAGPMCAQAQQESTHKTTKVEAEKLVKLISGDKAKTAIYCDIVELIDEADQAEQKKDSKKAESLYDKIDELGEKLGPEYVVVMEGLQNMESDSKASEEITSVLAALDKLCEK